MKFFQAVQVILIAVLLHSPSLSADAASPDAVWIDVRSAAEFATGSLAGAHPIPFDGIEAGVQELALKKDTPIYLFCASGGRSGMAKKSLDQLGFTNVENVGGLEDARAKVAQTPD